MDPLPPLADGVPMPEIGTHLVVEYIGWWRGDVYLICWFQSAFWQPRVRIVLRYSHWYIMGEVSIPVYM